MKALWLSATLAGLWTWASPVAACERSSECEVRGATCRDGECRISSEVFLFPGLKELDEVELLQPASFATTTDAVALRWEAPLGTSLVAAGIFRSLPKYAAKRPGNISDFTTNAVWVWLSEAESSGSGLARFQDGRAPKNDPALGVALGSEVAALEPGIYYWGVWAWTGSSLTHRSQLRSFSVGEEPLTGASCQFRETLVNVQCTQTEMRLPYQVISCASDADCYEGTTCDLTVSSPDFAGGVCRGDCDCRAGCSCDEESECDMATGICANASSAALPFDGGEASCGCRGVGTTREPRPELTFVALIVFAIVRTRRRATGVVRQ